MPRIEPSEDGSNRQTGAIGRELSRPLSLPPLSPREQGTAPTFPRGAVVSMTAKPPDNETPGDSRPIRTYWLTAGAGTIIVALIAALAALKPWSSNPPASQPAPSQTVSTTPATSSSPTARLDFSDKFCTTAFGWTVGNGH